ncbi:MAG: hypothetical protein ACOH1E_07395 [Brevundimonas sp.]
MTRGVYVGAATGAAEKIQSQWSRIGNRVAEQVLASGAAQYHHEVGHPDRSPALASAKTPQRVAAEYGGG